MPDTTCAAIREGSSTMHIGKSERGDEHDQRRTDAYMHVRPQAGRPVQSFALKADDTPKESSQDGGSPCSPGFLLRLVRTRERH
jgi:hypothetical protein